MKRSVPQDITHGPASTAIQFRFDNSYAEQLSGFYVSCDPMSVPSPVLLQLNRALAAELGLNAGHLNSSLAAEVFSGRELPAGAQPLAQAYAGHQFGGFVPQLGIVHPPRGVQLD